MRSNAVRAGVAVALIALAVVLFVVLKDDDDGGGGGETTPTTAAKTGGDQGKNGDKGKGDNGKQPKPAVPTVVVKGGKPVGGVTELEFNHGDEIRFRVVSDVADEVHLHGYNITMEVEAGGSVSFDFAADIEGVFEAELEQRQEQILELRVNP